MKVKYIIHLVLGVIVVSLCACEKSITMEDIIAEHNKYNYTHLPFTANELDIVKNERYFSWKFFEKFSKEREEDFVFSPYSLHLMLSMTSNGAKGETGVQLYNLIGNNTALSRSFYKKMAEGVCDIDPEYVTTNIVNTFWSDPSANINPDFLSIMSDYRVIIDEFNQNIIDGGNDWYQGDAHKVSDFKQNGNDVKMAITSTNSGNYIFDPYNNYQTLQAKGAFHNADGSICLVNYIHGKKGRCLVRKCERFTAVQPVIGRLSFRLCYIVPNEGYTIDDCLEELTTQNWRFISQIESVDNDVDVLFPEFSLESVCDLTPSLKEIGLTYMFSPESSDFSGICDTPAYFSHIMQKTSIAVNSKGANTESNMISRTGISELDFSEWPSSTIIVNRPFIFTIQGVEEDFVWFMGKKTHF